LEEGRIMDEEYKVEEGIFYTQEHEWARKLDDGNVEIGLADYAQEQLHEIVYVELPEMGMETKQMEPCGAVESVKAVSDVYSPVSGTVVEVNESLLDAPEKINEDPYKEGWIARIEPNDLNNELENLMDSSEYREYLKTQEH
jgi:glycine cleavage system H protein